MIKSSKNRYAATPPASYQYSIAELKVKYSDSIIMIQRLPQVLSTAMGDEVIIARFEKEDKMLEFMHDAVR